ERPYLGVASTWLQRCVALCPFVKRSTTAKQQTGPVPWGPSYISTTGASAMKRWKLFLTIVVLLALSSGLVGWGIAIAANGSLFAAASSSTAAQQQQQPTGTDILQRMHDTLKNAKSAQGTVQLSVTINKDGIKQFISQFVPFM